MRQKYSEKIRVELEKLKRGVESGRLKEDPQVHKRILKAYYQGRCLGYTRWWKYAKMRE